jgi:hypothetical protein
MSSSRICLIADSVLRTSSAISSYTTRAHGIIVKYISQTYTGWRKKKLTCLIYFNLKTKRAIRPKLRALHSVLFNLNFDIRPVQFRAILTERAAFKLE